MTFRVLKMGNVLLVRGLEDFQPEPSYDASHAFDQRCFTASLSNFIPSVVSRRLRHYDCPPSRRS